MEPLAEQLIKEHIVDLQREATASRLVKAASERGRGSGANRPPRIDATSSALWAFPVASSSRRGVNAAPAARPRRPAASR